MSNEKQIAIVVWHWSEAISNQLPPGQNWDWWSVHSSKAELVRADLDEKITRAEVYDWLAELARKRIESNADKVLYLLHTSSPHNFDESARLELARCLQLPSDRLRVRLFGLSGRRLGPAYFGVYSTLGVLGRRGNLPASYSITLPDGRREEVWSNLVVDASQKLLNPKHLEHLWACYWETPFTTLWRLEEDFQQHTMGYDFQLTHPPRNLREYLRQDPLLWHKLISFANREDLATDPHLLRAAADCRADNHCSHLNWLEENALSERLSRLRDYVADLLDEGPSAAALSDHEHIDHISSELKAIVELLPPNLRLS
ncbi:MAG: hypothetical protein ABMA02_12185 [Saprospiraceae bacterium]